MGIDDNKKTDFWARTAAEERVDPIGNLTFSELSSLKKIDLNQFGRTPWHLGGKNPGGSFMLKPRKHQIAFSCCMSSHIEVQKNVVYPNQL
ncbi:hypothetical protein TNCV_2141861 [Trichonephila clavipes]|uniref:Uncharacterized protein n=1 Tax=Trichonephila clavipes TaxID=2585209 RepID=A0A8X6RTJ6_TRICX|nr:hypothetical protein TNCV_2141861 [Trichonephila clavipes]